MNSPTSERLKELKLKYKLTVPKMAKAALVGQRTMESYLAGKSKMHPYVYNIFKEKIKKI